MGHEVGGKPYQYPGQCVFFGKMQDSSGHLTVTNLCSTVQDWLLDAYGVPWNIGDGTWLGFRVRVRVPNPDPNPSPSPSPNPTLTPS